MHANGRECAKSMNQAATRSSWPQSGNQKSEIGGQMSEINHGATSILQRLPSVLICVNLWFQNSAVAS